MPSFGAQEMFIDGGGGSGRTGISTSTGHYPIEQNLPITCLGDSDKDGSGFACSFVGSSVISSILEEIIGNYPDRDK